MVNADEEFARSNEREPRKFTPTGIAKLAHDIHIAMCYADLDPVKNEFKPTSGIIFCSNAFKLGQLQ